VSFRRSIVVSDTTNLEGDVRMAVVFEISMSLDGFVAGPNPSLEEPLGEGGEGLHEWVLGLASFRDRHGRSGGSSGPDDDLMAKEIERVGATVMGRNMFGGGEGPWGDEPWEGWWGDEPPFHGPVFVVTHHPREPLVKDGGTTFTFVPEGVEAAVEQARAAAGDKDVHIGGGASIAQQCLKAGLVDEMLLHLVPTFLGGGTRLFDDLDGERIRLEKTDVLDSPAVTHLRFRVLN
jgi:dihydrofolate reductase